MVQDSSGVPVPFQKSVYNIPPSLTTLSVWGQISKATHGQRLHAKADMRPGPAQTEHFILCPLESDSSVQVQAHDPSQFKQNPSQEDSCAGVIRKKSHPSPTIGVIESWGVCSPLCLYWSLHENKITIEESRMGRQNKWHYFNFWIQLFLNCICMSVSYKNHQFTFSPLWVLVTYNQMSPEHKITLKSVW